MDAGKDETMIDIHERALNRISDVLIELQDDTIKRMSDALEHAEEIAKNALIPCMTCGGSGFSKAGSGYDAVCDDCTGGYVGYATGEMVNQMQNEIDELRRKINESKPFYHPAFDEGDGVYRP